MSEVKKSQSTTSAELIKQAKERMAAKKKELEDKQIAFENGLQTEDGVPIVILDATKYLNHITEIYNKKLKGKIFVPGSSEDKIQKEYERLIKKKQAELDKLIKDTVSLF